MDLSAWMDAHQPFNLMRVHIFWLGQNRVQHLLVVVHVEILRTEQLIDVINAQPEVLVFVQLIQVSLLLLTERQEKVFHA